MGDPELQACTPHPVNVKAFNPKAVLPWGLTTAHVQAAMVEFTDFLGFINQQLNTKGIPRTSVVSTIAQEVIPAFA